MPDHDTPDLDELGWPVRTLNGERVCARPSPGHYSSESEFRIDGYCSCECRDMHEVERERDAMQAELEILSAQDIRIRAQERTERDELRAVNDRLMEERRAILLVKTTDGLTSSEWILRTGLAKARAEKAEARVKDLEGLYVRQCALTELKDERAARAEADRDEAVTLLSNLYAMVLGESPALLEGDHNGEKVAVYLAQKETR